MGIQGLLPLLKSIQKPCNLKQFAGETIGVDGYGWLHRGTVACSFELATGKPTTKYIDFAMSRVRMLKHFGIKPYIILDGDYLPSKSKTEKERAARRREARNLGNQLMSLGKINQAYLEFQKAVDVTPEMAGLFIAELRRANVSYIVAPYEADSQMVYLEKKGIINGILSEDSDLLVFGARILLTKLDQYGDCVMVRRDDFTACREVSFVGWSDQEFRQMAILSGCDYLASIGKMGLKTAHRLLRKHKTVERVLRAVQFDGKFKVPPGYLESFTQAERTFLHQWVYCPEVETLVHLTPLDDKVSLMDLPYIGHHVEATLAGGVARGELHPHTKESLQLPKMPRKWTDSPNHKSTVPTTPDLKKHKSIETFFKPQRTPLAEIDVNLFTGTPHQQAMARRASGSSWPATPITNTPPISLERSVTMPASASVHARRSPENATSVRKTGYERGVKRQRLCADRSSPGSERHADGPQYGTSKFFGSSKPPSKRSKSEISKKSEFNLWSDESLEEAMKGIPLPGSSTPQPKLQGGSLDFNDTKTSICSQSEVLKSKQSTAETQVTDISEDFSQDQTVQDTPPSSAENEARAIRMITPFDQSPKDEVAAMCQNFAVVAPKPLGNLRRIPSMSGSALMKGSGKSRTRPNVKLPDLSQFLAFSTSASVASDPKSEPELSLSFDLPNNEDGRNNGHEILTGDAEEVQSTLDNAILVPGSDAIEHSSPEENEVQDTRRKVQSIVGSEDLLVSESEAEGSEQGTPKAAISSGVFLNLDRFAFTAP